MRTCRIAAEELRDRLVTKLQFGAHLSYGDGSCYMGLYSRAGRFNCMLMYTERQKRRMLINVFDLLHQEDLLNLYSRHPSVRSWFEVLLPQSAAQKIDLLTKSEGYTWKGELSTGAFIDALDFALVCARNRNGPEFARLAGDTFGPKACPLASQPRHAVFPIPCLARNIFVKGAMYDVYSWRPEPWKIPDEDELVKLEDFICLPDGTETGHPDEHPDDLNLGVLTTDGDIFFFRGVGIHNKAGWTPWYFSAASIAIDFLQRMPQGRRLNLRTTIILNENFKAVSRPELHARGLVPFCLENPNLRVERRIALWANLLPDGSVMHDAYGTAWHHGPDDRLAAVEGFMILILWIEEAYHLVSNGMPSGSFTLLIDGSTEESVNIWTFLKFAAATQEARLEQCRLSGRNPPPERLIPNYHEPWDLPSNFSKMIRDIVEGSSVIKYEGDVGELWDQDAFFDERRNWVDVQWDEEWNDNILYYEIPTSCRRLALDHYCLEPNRIGWFEQTIRPRQSGPRDRAARRRETPKESGA